MPFRWAPSLNLTLALLLASCICGWRSSALAQEPSDSTEGAQRNADEPNADEPNADASPANAAETSSAANSQATAVAGPDGPQEGAVLATPAEPETCAAPPCPEAADELASPKADAADAGDKPPEIRSKAGMVWDPETNRFRPNVDPLRWRNTFFVWDNSLTVHSLDPSAGQTHNPTYLQAFSIRPRWYFDDTTSLRLRQDLLWEVTDSDLREDSVFVTDTLLELWRTDILRWKELMVNAGLRLVIPISETSRAADVYFGAGFRGTVGRVFKDVLAGLAFTGTFSYTYFAAGSNIVRSEDQYPCRLPDAGGTTTCSQNGLGSTIQHEILAGVNAALSPISRLTFNLGFFGWWRKARGLAPVSIDIPGAPGPIIIDDGSATHWRNLTIFNVSADYMFTDYLLVSTGLQTVTSQIDPDGSRRNPLYNPDSQLFLTAIFIIDQFYSQMKSK